MKYYDASFFDSLQFYSDYFLPNISLKKYVWSQSQLGDNIKDIEAEIQRYYMTLCTNFLKENVIFYSELSSYILDENKNIKLLDEYVFMKLRYYATRFLDLINEAENFFEEEIIRFRENDYDQSLLSLCTANLQHQQAKFYLKDSNLIIHFQENQKFQFYGVRDWSTPEFFALKPTVVETEVFEKAEGLFEYNILWNHVYFNGENYSETSIEFKKVKEIVE